MIKMVRVLSKTITKKKEANFDYIINEQLLIHFNYANKDYCCNSKCSLNCNIVSGFSYSKLEK